MRFLFWQMCVCALLPLVAAAAHAADATVIVGKDASGLERRAAEAVVDQLRAVWAGAEIDLAGDAPRGDAPLIVTGAISSESVAAFLGDPAPKLSDQGILLRSLKKGNRDILIVAGGSPRAALWA